MTPNPDFAEEIKASFAKQTIMGLIGAELSRVEPGIIEIALPYRADLAQQHGYLHAGIVTTIADSACGYAAYSLMRSPSASEVHRFLPRRPVLLEISLLAALRMLPVER